MSHTVPPRQTRRTLTPAEHEQAIAEEREELARLSLAETERTLTEYGVSKEEIALIIGSAE
ncbi:hypothetical protein [Streptomyces sp. NPDC096033]|uniref:hypothetical protein n=1 Tax=Streptomyces sp. NPDC096033 TaxID=3366071 RepID=UPI003801ECD6